MIALLMFALAQSSVPFTTVVQGDFSAIERAREAVAQTDQEWEALWKAHEPNLPPPQIDLATRTVIGVFLGTRPTAGHGVEIRQVAADGSGLVVEYVVRAPAPDAVTGQILTSPCHVISVPKPHGPVRFARADQP